VRVSTSKQAEEGLSLDAQSAKVRAHVAHLGAELVEVIVDAGESAKSLERPGLQRALSLLGGTADALLVVKLDRLTRSSRDLEALLEDHFHPGGSALLSCAESIDTVTAGGRMVLRILMAVAQHERESTGERTSAIAQHMRREGKFTGGECPFGYRKVGDGALEPDPREQSILVEAKRLSSTGESLRAIARALDAQGFLSRSGSRFNAMQVARMLKT